MRSFLHAKSMAKSLRQDLANRNLQLSHGECLEMVARQFGLNDWNTLAVHIGDVSPSETKLTIPQDWAITGSVVNGSTHRLGLDPAIPEATLIESLVPRDGDANLTGKIAVLMQSIDAAPYRGYRLRLSAELRTEEADAGTIWLRIDGPGNFGMRFDNMMNRTADGALRGTCNWVMRNIVLDVPDDAESIHYGFFLKGYGKVWARTFRLETVSADTPLTALKNRYLPSPSNLDFSRR